jgi:hypothetical protein
MEASVLPGWTIELLTDRSFHTVAAKVVVATELFIAAGLWRRPTRYVAVWVAICFHVAIQLSASVETFSVLAISALVVWAVPSTRDRVLLFDGDVPSQRRMVVAVRALDWLARFRIEERAGPAAVRDRHGTELRGTRAVVLVLSRLPLTAWFALPFTWRTGTECARHTPSAPSR